VSRFNLVAQNRVIHFWFDRSIRKEYGREAADQFDRGARKLRNSKSWQHGKIKNCRKFDLVARLQIQFDPGTSGLSSNKWLTVTSVTYCPST